MQVPFNNAYSNHRRFPPPNNFQRRPDFVPRGPSRFRAPVPYWNQPLQQEHTNEFWCETCDRGFRTSDILETHKQQHQKCNIDGCQFIAHPKVITKHIQMQHASGLYKKIAKLQDPEEIRKWREERKKKYPTKENVEKASAAIKEKMNRGEKIGLKNNRHEKNQDRGSGFGGKKQPFNKRNNRMFHSNENSTPDSRRRKNIVQKLPAAEDTRKLKPFVGIQKLIMDTDEQQEESECSFSIEDVDELVDASIPSEATSGSVCLALSSLICDYGSTDEDESHNASTMFKNPTLIAENDNRSRTTTLTSNQATDKKDNQFIEKHVTLLTRNESDDDSGPEEIKVSKPVVNESEDTKTKPLMNKRKAKGNVAQKPVIKKIKPKLPSTLLQKLLFKEMKHERNIVLQCIRHIMRNNFFEKSL